MQKMESLPEVIKHLEVKDKKDQTRGRRRSPEEKAKSIARLLHFQQRFCEEHGLHTRRRLEEKIPNPSPCSSPQLRPAEARVWAWEEGKRDLSVDFERIGADAQLHPLTKLPE